MQALRLGLLEIAWSCQRVGGVDSSIPSSSLPSPERWTRGRPELRIRARLLRGVVKELTCQSERGGPAGWSPESYLAA